MKGKSHKKTKLYGLTAPVPPFIKSPVSPLTITENGSVTIDFGVEAAGWLEIDCAEATPCKLTLGVSEYNAPHFVNIGPRSPNKTAVPKLYKNERGGVTYRLELNDELYEGVRFGFINIADLERPFVIGEIRLVCRENSIQYRGSFDCDNSMLNKIWYTAAHTVRLNLRDDYLSAILVDRGDRHSWTGDAYPAQIASMLAFGNYGFVLQNLKYTAAHKNGIEAYELYWLQSVADYYMETGDGTGVTAFLPEMTERLDRAVEVCDKIEAGECPNLVFFGWDERLGGGFERPNLPECAWCYRFLAIGAWRVLSAVLADIGEMELAERYETLARERAAAILMTPNLRQKLGLHAMAEAINSGVLGAECAEVFITLAREPSYSPFNQYFVINAMARLGLYDAALASINSLWGGQIRYGGTTFFEVFRPDWRAFLSKNSPLPNNQAGYTSLCHPWSAGVLPWLTRNILGVAPTSAGYKTARIAPNLSGLRRVCGAVPTPFGELYAEFDAEQGRHKAVVPDEITALLVLPNGNEHTLSGGTYEFITEPQTVFRRAAVKTKKLPRAVREGLRSSMKKSDEVGSSSDGLLACGADGGIIKILPPFIDDIVLNLAERIDLGGGEWAFCTGYNRACRQTFTVDITTKTAVSYTAELYFIDSDKQGREQVVECFDYNTLESIAATEAVRGFAEGVVLCYRLADSARFRINQMRGEVAVLNRVVISRRSR